MAWSLVKTISINSSWQYTDPVEGEFFRFKHTSVTAGGIIQVAQAEFNQDNSVSLGETQTLEVGRELDILRLQKPAYFAIRRLAVRRINQQPSLESQLRSVLKAALFSSATPLLSIARSGWSIQIAVSDIEANTSERSDTCALTSKLATTASQELLAINPNRKGVILFNDSLSNLFIEFGNPASITSIPKLTPKAYYEIPFKFSGAINGIWETSSSESGVIIKEFS